MQRRTGHPSSSLSSAQQPKSTIGGSSSSRFPRRQKGSSQNSKFKKLIKPLMVLLGLFVVATYVSYLLFPSQVLVVEHEAEVVGQRWAQQAMDAEHQVEDWWNKNNQGSAAAAGGGHGQQQQQQQPNIPRRSSEEATARMLAQSSTWVDGEKALKKKLAILEEEQKQNKNLGVPVLTRWLGDDFPAWVTPDMDEADWRKKVEAKYAEMRKEEEEWIKQMQKIIDNNEHGDIGITTTAR